MAKYKRKSWKEKKDEIEKLTKNMENQIKNYFVDRDFNSS